ncbi:MAG: helix-turn-helix domain-containing protein [Cellulosilyticaceae bacterium]
MATFSERFKQLRTERRLTQDRLAELFFLNKSSISRYESGKQIPEPQTLQKFADFFDVSLDYLMGKSDRDTPCDVIPKALESDTQLIDFWNQMKERESLQLLFKQTKDMNDRDINQVLRIIKAIEDEEDRENNL